MNKTIFKISISAMMTAIAIVLDAYLSFAIRGTFLKITLYGFPLMFIGYFFGPFYGLIGGIATGLVNDLLGYGISISTVWWIIAPVMWGLIPGLFLRKYKEEPSFWKTVIIVVVSSIGAYLANTLAFYLDLWIVNYASSELTLISMLIRLLNLVITAIIYSIFLYRIIYSLQRRINNKIN